MDAKRIDDTAKVSVGDRVLVGEPYGWGRRYRPGTVKRKTPSGITIVAVDAFLAHGTIAHDVTFDKRGRERGRGYRGRELAVFDQAFLEAQEEGYAVDRLRRRIEDVRWSSQPDAVIKAVAELIAERAEAKK